MCWTPRGCVKGCFDVCATLGVCAHTHSRQLMQLASTAASCNGHAAARDHVSYHTDIGQGCSPFTAKHGAFNPSAADSQVYKHGAMSGYRCTSFGQY